VASFVRKVPTASGATAVQVVHKHGRAVVGIDHVGSAHDDVQLAVLMQVAAKRLRPGQGVLDLDGAGAGARPRVVGTRCEVLWDVLTSTYARLGFDELGDAGFRAMVLARLVEPTSKAEVIRVLDQIGAPGVSLRTLFRSLGRAQARDYRALLASACLAHSARLAGKAALIMYDCTTLHFTNELEDDLRKVGMSKEHRVDPQVQIGLLVDPAGFPLEVHLFDGAKAETTTLIPVLKAFQARHGITDMVVVADAGMLSAGNLNAIEDAGFAFIVGSRIVKAPYDLAEHFERHGNYFTDGQILESARIMGTGAGARSRRVVYQWRFKREQRDQKTINAQITKAEKVADGSRPLRRDRFVKISGAAKAVDWAVVERARQLAGLKGYVTNLPATTMDGAAIIDAYHDLWHVEQSFRMTKSDLAARPIFHHEREAIEAHITVVFAALAIARDLQERSGMSIKRLIQALQPLLSVTIDIQGHQITAEPTITTETRTILNKLTQSTGY